MATDRIEKQTARREDLDMRERELRVARGTRNAAVWMNCITAAAAVGAFVGAVGVIVSILDARDASVEAKKASVTSNRAWLGVSDANVVRGVDDPKGMMVAGYATNSGKTPALDTMSAFATAVVELTAPLKGPEFPKIIGGWPLVGGTMQKACFKNKPQVGSSIVWPGGKLSWPATLPANSDLKAIKEGRAVVLAFGCVTYRTFDEVHHTSFCKYATDRRTGEWALINCPSGNAAD